MARWVSVLLNSMRDRFPRLQAIACVRNTAACCARAFDEVPGLPGLQAADQRLPCSSIHLLFFSLSNLRRRSERTARAALPMRSGSLTASFSVCE
jgi:hypothetical protein